MESLLAGFLSAVKQIAVFLLFQTVLLGLLEQTRYEKYVRMISGFLLILLMVSSVLRLVGGENLLEEVLAQVEFATEDQEMRRRLEQAEEEQKQLMGEEYEAAILVEAEDCLAEDRLFVKEGAVRFNSQWEVEELYLVLSRLWVDPKGFEQRVSEVKPIRIAEVESVGEQENPVESEPVTDQLQPVREKLADRLGILAERISLELQE